MKQNKQTVIQYIKSLFGEKCKHHKYGAEVYQTLYGHGIMCTRCKYVVTYERWPDGYNINAVPDWSKSETELTRQLTKRRQSN